jgi:1-deoxy-D-xylulose-5-phosphate reductoisomerase
MPAVMNAANEICVEEFLKGRIKFLDISRFTEKVLDRHSNRRLPTLEDILEADSWARQEAFSLMQRKSVSR